MTDFEKVERLRAAAPVSFDEAKSALQATGGDLLDAMIYLEKQGLVPSASSDSKGNANTTYVPNLTLDSNANYQDFDSVNRKEQRFNRRAENRSRFREFCNKAWQKGCDNSFIMEHDGKRIIDIPVWVFVLVVLCTFNVVLPVMLISLFFGCRYSFQGKDDLSKVNDIMGKASDVLYRQ